MKRELFGLTDEHGNKVSIVLDGAPMDKDGKAYWDIIQVKTLAPVEKEPKFKVGDWVIRTSDACGIHFLGKVFRIVEIGESPEGELRENNEAGDYVGTHCISSCRLATLQQIEDHLKKICDEKYIGKKVRSMVTKDNIGIIRKSPFIRYYGGADELWYETECSCNVCVYRKGQFAEIIEDKKKLPKTKEELENAIVTFLDLKQKIGSAYAFERFLEQYKD
jgi:hypothetical protein